MSSSMMLKNKTNPFTNGEMGGGRQLLHLLFCPVFDNQASILNAGLFPMAQEMRRK